MGPADHRTCIAHAMAAVAAGGGGGGGGQGQEEGGGGGAAGTAAAAAAFPATAVAASAAAASEEPNVKALQKRYDALFAVRSKAVKGKGAWYWSHLEPLLVPHPDTGNPRAVKLRCCLCSAMFSASNPSRTASEHLKRGTCPHFNGLIPKSAAAAASSLPLKSGASPAPHQQLQVQAVQQQQQRKRPAPGSSIGGGGGGGGGPGASSLQQHQQQQQQSQGPMSMSMALAVVTEAPAVRSSSRASVQEAEVVRASPTPLVLSGGKGDLGALAQLEKSVKKLKSPGGCVKPGSGGPAGRQQADAALDLLSEWLYESCGTVPFSCVEHPKFRAFLAQLGLPSLSRRALQGDRLDAKFAQVKGECEAKLRDAMFFQLSAHGWRRPQHPQQHQQHRQQQQQQQQHEQQQQQQHEQQQQRPLMLLLQQPEHHHVHGGGGGVNVGSGLGHGHHGGYGGHGGLWGLQQYQQQQLQQQELLLHQQQQEGGGTGGVQVSLNLPNGGAVFRGVIPLAGGPGSGSGRSSDSSSSGSDSENVSSSGAGASAAAAEAGAVLEEAIMRLGLAGEPPERCVGVVADACSKARRRALAELENRQAWMVNLACQNAAFQGLLKDMHKHLHLLRSVVCDCSELHRLFTTDAAARAALQKLDMPMPMPAPPAGGGAAAPHPTFLFNLLDQVAASAQALQLVSLDDHLKLHCGGDKEKQELLALLPACSRFWHQLDSARALLRILHDMLADMAAERPMLSQCLPLWVDLRNKVKDWSAHYDQDEAPVHRLIDKRFRKNYHPAWAAAFILDPLYLLRDTSGKYLPPFKFLTPEQERDVDRLITRLVSKDEAHLALRELFNWRTVGLDPLYAQAVQVKERDPGSGRMKAVSPQSRRLVWETCLSEFKSLRKVATRLIFLHATSASVDCNWPLWRWAFRGSNASEKLDKLVFIAAQARLDRRGDFPAAGHQEGDLQDDAGIFINGDDAAAASAAADHHHLFFPSASSAL